MDGADRIDGDGVFPRRVLSGGEAEGGRHGGVEEGDGLAGLIEAIIPIGVGQGVEAIRTGGNVADREASAIVCLGSSIEGQAGESRVGRIGVQPDDNVSHRLQVLGIEQHAAYLERVDHVARREGKAEMADGVLLVVVRDGMTEVDGVRGVGLQRVLELDADLPPDDLNAGQLLLWRSDDHVLRRFIDLNQFIENDLHASPLVVRLLRWRCTADKPGRLLVIRPTVRSRHIGARHSAPDQQSQPQSFHHVWHARLHSFIHPPHLYYDRGQR